LIYTRTQVNGKLTNGQTVSQIRTIERVSSLLQVNSSVTFFLRDAIYLYLRVLNQTLTEGYTDFSDGRLIRDKAVGQEFDGNCR